MLLPRLELSVFVEVVIKKCNGRHRKMKIVKEALAGTLESSDLLVKVAPSPSGTVWDCGAERSYPPVR